MKMDIDKNINLDFNMNLDFDKMNGLIPAIIQDCRTKDVLMLGFMNRQAYDETCETGYVTFFSRTKQRLWKKGEVSGNTLKVQSVAADCDNDTILIRAIPNGPACHTGERSCFGDIKPDVSNFLHKLENVIANRKFRPSNKSYTSSLFEKGINRIAQKVGEEAVELIIASKDENGMNFLNEAADLLFHYLVLLKEKEFCLDDVIEVLIARHKC